MLFKYYKSKIVSRYLLNGFDFSSCDRYEVNVNTIHFLSVKNRNKRIHLYLTCIELALTFLPPNYCKTQLQSLNLLHLM